VVIGGGEVNRTKSRVDDRLEENALQGRPMGSRPAGYRHARVRGVNTYEVVEEEWRPRLWAAYAVLDGMSVKAAAEALRKRGVAGSHRRILRDENKKPIIDPETGEPAFRTTQLSDAVLRTWMTSPAVAGLRVHKGKVIGRGNWPPLLCNDPFAENAYEQALVMRNRLLARLGKPREVRSRSGKSFTITATVIEQPRRSGRRYLLTGGKGLCGECEHKLVAGLKHFGKGTKKKIVPYYWCTTTDGGGGCVGIKAEWLETYVRDRLMKHVATDEFAATFASDPHVDRREAILDELETMSVKRGKLASLWASELLADEEWESAKAVLDEREAATREELLTIPPPPPDDDFDPRVLADPRVWANMLLGERRAVVDRVVDRVELKKATPPYGKFDDSRVEVFWK